MKTLFILFTLLLLTYSIAFANDKKKEPSVLLELKSEYLPSSNFDSAQFVFAGTINLFKIGHNQFKFKTFAGYRNTNGTDSSFPKDLYKLGFQLQSVGKEFLFFTGLTTNTDKLFNSIDEWHSQAVFGYNILNSKQHFFYLGVLHHSRFVYLPENIDHYPFPYFLYMYKEKKFMIMGPIPFRLNCE